MLKSLSMARKYGEYFLPRADKDPRKIFDAFILTFEYFQFSPGVASVATHKRKEWRSQKDAATHGKS